MAATVSPLSVRNVRLYLVFRVFFHSRYYYPIFTLLFLDYGLSLETFALLNTVWTLAIVLFEVPSGALADIIGRRNLLVAGALLMVVEMAVLLLVPVGGGLLTIAAFTVNRLASGVAEAMVSGADEALAYDSLKERGLETLWPRVLELAQRFGSAVMAVAMILGGLSYDPALVNGILRFFGSDWEVTKDLTVRFPVFLTLLHGCVVVWAAWQLREPGNFQREAFSLALIRGAFSQILRAGAWTLNNRFVLFVILGALVLDSVARYFVVLNAEYLRLIRIPEGSFGFIGAGLAFGGVFFATVARYLVRHYSPFHNLLILATVLLASLTGVAFALPYAGIVFIPFIFGMMGMAAFFSSHYINREVDSSRRATVLSFRGLALNLGLATASTCYLLLIAALKEETAGAAAPSQQDVFVEALGWFPGYLLVLLVLVILGARLCVRRRHLLTTVQA